jgi:uncharacterized protein with HEPN domain
VFAVIRVLEVAGEATKQIPEQMRQKYRILPWREMARDGTERDKLIHHYFGVDLNVVWKTVTEDVPALIPLVEKAVSTERASGKDITLH